MSRAFGLEWDPPIATRAADPARADAVAWSLKPLTYAALGFVIFQAFVLKVSYWDSYDYLNDAAALGGAPSTFYLVHGPLIPMLLAPVVRALGSVPIHDPLHLLLPRIAGCALSIGAAFATFLYARRLAGTLAASAALFFFVTTGLFLHYGPHLLVDLPVAGWTAAALWLVLRLEDDRRSRDFALLGLVLAGACLTKYSVVALVPLCAAGALLLTRRPGCSRRFRLLGTAGTLALAALVMTIVFAWVADRAGETPWAYAREVLRELRAVRKTVLGEEGPLDYAAMLPVVVSPIVLLLSLGGAVILLRRDLRRAWVSIAWVALFVGSLLAASNHTEIRYLSPILPVIAAFAGAAVARIYAWIDEGGRRTRWALVLLGAALLASLLPGVVQVHRDTHAFYRTDSTGSLLEWIRVRNAPGDVLTSGAPLALVPPMEPLLEDDDFYDVYTVGHPAFRYLLARSIRRGRERPSAATPSVTRMITQSKALTSARIARGERPLESVRLEHCTLDEEAPNGRYRCERAVLDLASGRICAPVDRCAHAIAREPRKSAPER